MATMQKFKFFATHCAILGSPTRGGPTTSPIVQIRRRKTLRMLLGKGGGAANGDSFHRRFLHNRRRDDFAGDQPPTTTRSSDRSKDSKKIRSKLKDLFVSSPENAAEDGGDAAVETAEVNTKCGGGKPFSATLRQRLLMRRGWRPVLVAIPEVSP